jgi:hypothetical protein
MRAKAWLVVAGMAVAGAAVAAEWEAPRVDYSAESYLETAEGVMKGRLYSTPGKERREYVESGEQMTMIMRNDKKAVWMMMPADKAYMEMKFPKEGRRDNLSGYKIEQTTVGPETVNGIKTTKSKIIMTGPRGEKLGGFWWASKEGIIVKIDAIAVEKGSKSRFKLELKDLKVGRQDPALFEVPAGYAKMDMGGMMMRGLKDDGDDQSKGKSEDKSKDSGGFGLKDAFKLLK